MEEEFCHQDEGDEKEKMGKIKELSMWVFEKEKCSLREFFQFTLLFYIIYNTKICNLQLYY